MNILKLILCILILLPTWASAGRLLEATDPDLVIPDAYIVVFKENAVQKHVHNLRKSFSASAITNQSAVHSMAQSLSSKHKAKVKRTFSKVFKGATLKMNKAEAMAMAKNLDVDFIEPDAISTTQATQTNPTWGLDRIDQATLPLNSRYTYETTASNVNVYIIDTGIDLNHSDFGGRASSGWDFYDDDSDASDCDGHGTHVAGTVAGSTWGIAKGAKLIAVRVLGCDGSGRNSDVIAGMEWVAQNHKKPAVANMSLGGGASSAVDRAVQTMTNAGVTVAVAAGNENSNACNSSPARAPNALTVASSTSSDARSSFSNYGSCVDLFAPGSSIKSARIGSGSTTMSGTSMAAPHVAGVAALYLANNANASPSQVTQALLNNGTRNVISNVNGSPNILLRSNVATNIPGPIESGLSMSKPRYEVGETITVNYNNLPGNNTDWIALYSAGAANTAYGEWYYTNGATSGSMTFGGLAAGNYEARLFFNDSYTVEKKVTFTVEAAQAGYPLSIQNGSGSGSYLTGERVTITANTPPTGKEFNRWQLLSGSASIADVSSATTTLTMQNSAVTVAATYKDKVVSTPKLSLPKTSYAANEPIVVSYTNLPGNARDWISVFTASAANNDYGQWFYTNGATSGTMTFNGLAPGNYEIRLFLNDSYTVSHKIAFTVKAAETGQNLRLNKTSYTRNEPIVVEYANLPGNSRDWIAVFTAGASNRNYGQWFYTRGAKSGTMTFDGLAAGNYEVRLFLNDSYNVESKVPFTVK
jgi:serine protease